MTTVANRFYELILANVKLNRQFPVAWLKNEKPVKGLKYAHDGYNIILKD